MFQNKPYPLRFIPKLWSRLVQLGSTLITPITYVLSNTDANNGLYVRFTNSNRIRELSRTFLDKASVIIEDTLPSIVYLPATLVTEGVQYSTVVLGKIVTNTLPVCKFTFSHVKSVVSEYVCWSFVFASNIPVLIMKYQVKNNVVNVGIGRTATTHALEVEGTVMSITPHGSYHNSDPETLVDVKDTQDARQLLQQLRIVEHKMNPAFCEMTGFSNEELIGDHIPHKFWPEQLVPQLTEKVQQVLLEGQVYFETTFIRKDSTDFPASVIASPILDKSGEEIAYIGIIQDITERKAMEKDLKKMHMDLVDLTLNLEEKVKKRTQELMKANKLKSELMAILSHEFRTPLNAILSFTDLLYWELEGPINEQQKTDLKMIKESGLDLLNLINNVLDYSRIELGETELTLESIDIPLLVESMVSQLSTMATENNLKLYHDLPKELPPLVADEGKLRQILRNLIMNAIKFTDTGEIVLRVRYDDKKIIFSVQDTGIGISKEDQAVIFEKFKQAGEANTHRFGGSGLGLSLVKDLVKLHGGEIWVDSEIGKGSTFSFLIPVTPHSH